MAARVGSGVTGTGDANAGTIASAAKSTTSSNVVLVFIKWEWDNTPTNATLTSVADNAGNTYTIISQVAASGGTAPGCAVCVSPSNFVGDAATVVTATFSVATASFRRIVVEEFSGATTTQDDTAESNSGSGTTYSTAALTTTMAGLMFAGVAGFTTLTGKAAGGTPAASLGAAASDCFVVYYISASGQSITPGASANESNVWKMLAIVLQDSVAGSVTSLPSLGTGIYQPPMGGLF